MKLRTLSLAALSTTAFSQVPEGVKVGGFVDTYYAYDFNSPKDHERQFTTQPVRHNEFNVNLAYVDAVLKRDKTRGRLALQYGNSVKKNYAGEPTQGATSGPNDMQAIQEAYVGTRIGEKTWLDAGIFFGNIGTESWISKDNLTYTRSLNADYTPYYSTGVRIEHQLSDTKTFQVQLLNGWQNISENNHGKALAMQYKAALSERTSFLYGNFFGDEEVTSSPDPRFRSYHNFNILFNPSASWHYVFTFDVGHQSQKNNDGVNAWYTTILTARRLLNETDSLTMRAEYYNDRHDVNVGTGTANGFQVTSASVNFDRKLDTSVLWRSELRGFLSKDDIYPQGASGRNRLDGFVASSLAFWF
jgi:hypothetical protein